MAISVKYGVKHVLLVVACVCAGAVFAQDMVKVAPNNSKVLVDNDRVRVVEVTVKPGEKLPMHSHPPYIAYFVTAAKIKTTTADGKVTEIEHKAGDAVWSEPVTHANENIGTTTSKVVVTELKSGK